MRWIVACVLLGGCTSGTAGKDDPTDGTDVTDDTTTPYVEPTNPNCDPQPWPIDEETHQLERLEELFDDEFGLMWWMPEQPRGVVIMLHGNNQNISRLRTLEHEEFYNELSFRDIGYFAFNSTDGGWDMGESPDNVDLDRAARVRDHLIATTGLTEQAPVFTVGFSAGAAFAPVLANLGLQAGWDVRGFASHNLGPSRTAPVSSVMVAHENDNPQDGRDSHQAQVDLGEPALLIDLPETPVDPLRFTKIPGIDEQESQAWFDEMVDFGMIEPTGERITPITQTDDAFSYFENNSQGQGNARATTQLKVLWRLHIFSADRSCDEAQFFADQL